MDLATILNPTSTKQQVHSHPIYLEPAYHHGLDQYHHPDLHSPPLSPKRIHHGTSNPPLHPHPPHPSFISSFSPAMIGNMKPRSRFSALEDAIICQGVANGLTWGQISGQLPHRKRATCFNRYRTLQGIRKSRPHSMILPSSYYHHQSYPYDYHHHSYQSTSQWSPSPSPPSSTPILMMDTPTIEPNTSQRQRRPSICSSLSSSPLASPSSLPQNDQWNQYSYTRQPSNASTSPSSFYHYCPY